MDISCKFKPSFIAHLFNGLILLIAFVYFVYNLSEFDKFDAFQSILTLLLVSIAIGIHCLTHLGLEIYYDYDPINDISTFLKNRKDLQEKFENLFKKRHPNSIYSN